MRFNGFIKKSMQGVLAMLLIIWYTLSITGLDVHHDYEHGKTYIVACAFGTSCERIHPHSHCHDGEGDACMEDEDCCSDEFHLILSQGEDAGDSVLHISTAFHIEFIPKANTLSTNNFKQDIVPFHPAPPPDIPDILSEICILRV